MVCLPGVWTSRTLSHMRLLYALVGGFLVACVAAWASPAVAHEGPHDSDAASADGDEWDDEDADQVEDDADNDCQQGPENQAQRDPARGRGRRMT